MDWKNREDTVVVRLEPGEEVMECLEKLRNKLEITGACFHAIGAVDRVVLGHYDVEAQEYSEQTFEEPLEVASFTGNIGPDRIHAHITLGRTDFTALAGHCSSARVSGTFELFIERSPFELIHRDDSRTGLQVFALEEDGSGAEES